MTATEYQAATSNCDPRIVVIMEDDELERNALRQRLEHDKFHVQIAMDEEECLKFHERGCRLFALDVDMGGGPLKTLGLTTLSLLKQASQDCFCTILTGNADHVERATKLGANGVFGKEGEQTEKFVSALNKEFLNRASDLPTAEEGTLEEVGRIVRARGTSLTDAILASGAEESLLDAADSAAARQIVLEETTARNYITNRYATLVDRKYAVGLLSAEEEELSVLRSTLDEMDEPYYAEMIARLQALARTRVTNAAISTQVESPATKR